MKLLAFFALLLIFPSIAQSQSKKQKKTKPLLFSSPVKKEKRQGKPSRLFQSAQKKQKVKSEPSSPFNKKANRRTKKKKGKSDLFSREKPRREKEKQPERSPFGMPVAKRKPMGYMSSAFSTPSPGKKELAEISSAFATASQKEKERKEEYHKPRKRRFYPKTFPFERLRLFQINPNRKRERKNKTDRPRDPFGRKKRIEKKPPTAPQMDLFENGVLPKMKRM